VLAQAAAAAVFTLALHSLVLADTAAATIFTIVLPPLVLAEAAAAAVFAPALPPLVLAEGAAAAVVTSAPLSLVLAQAAAAAVFTHALPPLVLAEGAAAAVFTPAPLPLVLAKGRFPVRLLGGCRSKGRRSRGLARSLRSAARTLRLVALSPVVCTLLQHSLLARCGGLALPHHSLLARCDNLLAITVCLAQHILCIAAFSVVDTGFERTAVSLSPPPPLSLFFVLPRSHQQLGFTERSLSLPPRAGAWKDGVGPEAAQHKDRSA